MKIPLTLKIYDRMYELTVLIPTQHKWLRLAIEIQIFVGSNKNYLALRVPSGVDFGVLRQSHCLLINKEPVCVRPPKPYMAWNLTSMINYCRPWKKSIVTCSGFPAFGMLQLHKWHFITACGVLHAERSSISAHVKKRQIPRECHWRNFEKGSEQFFYTFFKNKKHFLNKKSFNFFPRAIIAKSANDILGILASFKYVLSFNVIAGH